MIYKWNIEKLEELIDELDSDPPVKERVSSLIVFGVIVALSVYFLDDQIVPWVIAGAFWVGSWSGERDTRKRIVEKLEDRCVDISNSDDELSE